MRHSSLLKLAFFCFAIFSSVNYAFFLLNPLHIGNLPFWIANVIADLIVIVVVTYAWISSLHYEMNKYNYWHELEYLKGKGESLLDKKVAVLIPTVNEDIEIVKETILASKKLKGNVKVYVLDDGARPEMGNLCKRLKVEYVTRDNRHHYKAGNLNHALEKVVKEDYVVVFDADFIPKEKFLEETLPYFIDKKVGAVQTPQVYYNSENLFSKGSQNLQDVFYDYIMPSKHLHDSAFCVGTNVVYRKEALDEIGGIPKVDHSEDVNTSLKLNEHGYKVFYVNKKLAYGLGPSNVISFFNQQYRWAKGGLTMLFRKSTLFNNKLSRDQKFSYFFSNLYYLTSISVIFYLFSPILAILFDIRPINQEYFNEWAVSYVFFFVANVIFHFVLIKKNHLYTSALGMLSFIPVSSAIFPALLAVKFKWTVTNTITRDLITRKVWPLIFYISQVVLVLYFFLSGILDFKSDMYMYLFWMTVNLLMSIFVLVNSYHVSYGRNVK